MGRKIEEFKEYIFNDWGLLKFVFILYTLGIFYVLGSGLRGSKIPPSESITLYGIDRVSGYYGPGSWAAWLLTAAACCIDRLFRKPKAVDRIESSARRSFAGMDVNIIGESAIEMGCLSASLVVLKIGTELGVLLASICLRRWGEHGVDKAPAIFSSLSACVLLLMDVAFDCILIDLTPRDAALNIFLVPRAVTQPPPTSALATLMAKSQLLETDSYIPLLSSLATGGDMNGVGMMVVYPSLFFCLIFFLLYSKRRMNWRVPLYAFATIFTVHVAFFVTFTFIFFLSYVFPVYFWSFTSPPTTLASIMDLDQLSFLFLGGALIVVNSGVQLVLKNSRFFRGVWNACGSVYDSFARYLRLNTRAARRQETMLADSLVVDQGIPLSYV
ncbi:hypothetical protein BKA61DRAFT_739149 [Leptodontidium sp. MPI-SDFR-AT-0119]|nr:hypothetical protein BKA61DRAFT_739149 [Leptodontidium sp. MPI-SDFR-AT-0119]